MKSSAWRGAGSSPSGRHPGAAPARFRAPRALALVSGKGGVGKTNLAANLAVAAAGLGQRVLLVDGDLGLANLDVLLGLSPLWTVADVLEGRCTLAEAIVRGPREVALLPAASGRSELAALTRIGRSRLLGLLREAAQGFDLMLLDAAAGIGPSVVGLTAAFPEALLVATPEPTSLADAYATLKVLRRHSPRLRVELVVNAARSEREALDLRAQLERLTGRFLGFELGYRGALPFDPRLPDAVARQRAAVEAFPSAPWSRKLIELAQSLVDESGRDASWREDGLGGGLAEGAAS